MKKKLSDVGLPKWPAMIVQGESVTREQALEIIRRTDGWFLSRNTNDPKFDSELLKLLSMPVEPPYSAGGVRNGIRQYFDAVDDWLAKWGYIYTQYVSNSWLSSGYIYGPHGWCHPDGTVQFTDNIGKWPSVGEVAADWRLLVREFPFLNLTATLFDKEHDEDGPHTPLATFTVRNGKVSVSATKHPALFDWKAIDGQRSFLPADDMHPLPIEELREVWKEHIKRMKPAKTSAPLKP